MKIGKIHILTDEQLDTVKKAYYKGQSNAIYGKMISDIYHDTDSIIDGSDKTLCMYDVYERMVHGETKREILFPRQN